MKHVLTLLIFLTLSISVDKRTRTNTRVLLLFLRTHTLLFFPSLFSLSLFLYITLKYNPPISRLTLYIYTCRFYISITVRTVSLRNSQKSSEFSIICAPALFRLIDDNEACQTLSNAIDKTLPRKNESITLATKIELLSVAQNFMRKHIKYYC